VHKLHRQFWNHGGAPILVLISHDKIHVYSGMSRPIPSNLADDRPPSLVKTIDRVATGLKEFLASVESSTASRRSVKHTKIASAKCLTAGLTARSILFAEGR
jgi:hypothetical protein